MNAKIKEILEKYSILPCQPIMINNLNSAIIEICEEQKDECAKEVHWESTPINNTKNIAHE